MKNLFKLLIIISIIGFLPVQAGDFTVLGQAQQLLERGQTGKAIVILENALKQNDKLENRILLLGTLSNALVLKGELEKAIALYQEILSYPSDLPTRIKTYNNLVDARLKQIRYYRELEIYADQEGNSADAAQWRQQQWQQQQQAAGENEVALHLSENTPSRFGVLLRSSELGNKHHLAEAIVLSRSTQLPRRAESVNELLRLADSVGNLEKVEILKIAETLARSFGNIRLLAFAHLARSRAYYEQRQYDRSLSEAIEAASTASYFYPDILYQSYWLQGRSYEGLGQTQQAIANYQKAYQTLSSLRFALFDTGQNEYRDRVEPVFRDYLELLLAQSSPDLKKIISIVESFQIAELNNYFRDFCVFEDKSDLEQILYRERATAIYTLIGRGNTYFILITPDGLKKLIAIPIKAEQLDSMLRSWRATLENPFDPSYPQKGKQLYDILWKSLEPQIKTDKIIFIPDRYLRNVPIVALYDGRSFLVERYVISYSLGLANKKRAIENPKKAWLLGSSSVNGVAQELESIEKVIGLPTEKRLNFEEEDLSAALDSNSVLIHIATHGYFGGSLERSWIDSGGAKITLARFDEILQQARSKTSLLFLSACETAQSDERSFLGFAGLSSRSPVQASIGTLWPVNELSTITLVEEFYKTNFLEVERRLGESQKQLIQNTSFQHPYYWAAFLYVN